MDQSVYPGVPVLVLKESGSKNKNDEVIGFFQNENDQLNVLINESVQVKKSSMEKGRPEKLEKAHQRTIAACKNL